jgi:hypothetical protein
MAGLVREPSCLARLVSTETVRIDDSEYTRLSASQRVALTHVLDLVRQQEGLSRP